MPTYNRAATVGRAIDSVLEQSHEDVELIVVDDGSRDDTAAVVEGYGDRVTFIRGEVNRGGNWARNQGIARATGEIVSFLDSDDVFLPHKLRAVAEYFETRPDVDVLVDSYEIRYPAGHEKPSIVRRNPVIEDTKEFRRAVFARRLYKATPAISARRQALIDVGMFDETLRRRQDMDLLLRLSVRHRCTSRPDVLWIKYWTKGAISSKQKTFMAAVIDICNRHPAYLSDPAYRVGLERDLLRHFMRLIAAGKFGAVRRDLRQYREFGRFGVSPLQLFLRRLARGPKRSKRLGQRRPELGGEDDGVVAIGQQQGSRHLP